MPRRTKKFARMMEETLTEYPKETTIHGVKYLADRSSPIAHRIYWIIIFIISFSLLGNFVYKIGQRWQEKEVMLIDESLPRKVYEIPFPAITICPQIKYKQDKFNYFNVSLPEDEHEEPTDFEKKFWLVSNLCSLSLRIKIRSELRTVPRDIGTDFDWMDTLQEISPSLDDVFQSCQWVSFIEPRRAEFTRISKENCRELFSMILTNEGICFTFNTIRDVLRMDSLPADFHYRNITRGHDGWDPDKGYSKANPNPFPYKAFVKQQSSGTNGLTFILNANRSDITDLCPLIPSAGVGYNIAIHSPTEYPQTYGNFIPIEYGKKYRIAVIPKTTRASIDLISVPPEVRGCYFNEERKLKYYSFYSEHNCRLECIANLTTFYTSVPVPLPRDSNNTFDLSFAPFGWEEPEYFDLVLSHIEEFGVPKNSGDLNFYRECKCLPGCNSISYGFTVIENKESEADPFGDDVVGDDIVQTEVDILFNEPKFIGQKRVRLYTFDTMLSDFGGLLGLFIGGSLLSLFELFYFLIIRNCSKCSESKVVLAKN